MAERLSGKTPDSGLEKKGYVYRPRDENLLAPISTAESWPWLQQQYGPSWILPFLPKFLASVVRTQWLKLRFLTQRLTFRFDKYAAYGQILGRSDPEYVRPLPTDPEGPPAWQDDAAFAHWRIGGANPLLIRQERDLEALRARIPIDVARIEAWIAERFHPISLEQEAARGALFVCDFDLLERAQRPETATERDTRWKVGIDHASRFGSKYLPAPIGVFLEIPGFYGEKDLDLVPLAIQIDQHAGEPGNRVCYPDEKWPWRMAKMYFEVADTNWHDTCAHVFRTHFVMTPFCMASPRRLPSDHPVYVLLQPHMRYTLTTNSAAYKYFIDRKESYALVYAGSLRTTREIAIQGYETYSFAEMQAEADLLRRGVMQAPARYPYREDALLWMDAIREFVRAYLQPVDPKEDRYRNDDSVRYDPHLQAWADELMDPSQGAVRDLVPGGHLDTVEKLVELLTQVIFTAGPGHACMHFATNYFYRYPPAFPAAAYLPPALRDDEMNFARWVESLPPMDAATGQFHYDTFSNYKYDTFGDYRRYPLGRSPRAKEPIARLQKSLEAIHDTIVSRNEKRPLAYELLLPGKVPNSINI